MSLGWYTVGINSSKEGLDPLLPHVAGVIENMEEATLTDIKSQIERDLNENVSWAAILNAVENGCRLGLFNMEREFKVCREFTSKEIKKTNHLDRCIMLPKDFSSLEKNKRGRSLMDYVKLQREKRRKKLYKGKGGRHNLEARNYNAKVEAYSQLCQRCKKSIEKERSRSGKDSEMSSEEEEEEIKDKESVDFGGSSSASEISEAESKASEKTKQPPKKSRLLVEKNPMETDPPYCDIFT